MPDLGIVARYFRGFIYHCYWHIKTKVYRKNDNLMNHLGCYPPQINKTLLLGCHSVNDTDHALEITKNLLETGRESKLRS